MRTLDGEQILMRIFINESARWEQRPLHEALMALFHREHLAGATVLRGVAGFGSSATLHTDRLLALSQRLPLVIEVVDTEERIEAILPKLEKMLHSGLVTLEKARVIRYG